MPVTHSRRRSAFPSFPKARAAARALNLPSSIAYLRHIRFTDPGTLPSKPEITYAAQWKGWPDYLGQSYTPRKRLGPRNRYFPTFTEARSRVRKLELTSGKDFQEWVRNHSKPRPLPLRPDRVYIADWKGWADFIGPTYKEGNDSVGFRFPEFDQARRMVRALHFKSAEEYYKFARAQKTRVLPKNPPSCYGKRFKGWADFLGERYVPPVRQSRFTWTSFSHARELLHEKGFTTRQEYWDWIRTPEAPPLPVMPSDVYADKWKGWKDFLGYKTKTKPKLDFAAARKLVRKLQLGHSSAYLRWWQETGPKDMPRDPPSAYRADWKGWADFLGRGRSLHRARQQQIRARNRMKQSEPKVSKFKALALPPGLLQAIPVTVKLPNPKRRTH